MSVLLLLLVALTAQAKSFPERERITVPVPRSELKIEPVESKAPEFDSMELGFSSWKPKDFERKDYRHQSSAFSRSFPQVSLNYRSPFLFAARGANLAYLAGVSYASLERTGIALSRPAEVTQTLHLYQARAGLEYNGPKLRFLAPYLRFSLLPTLLLAPDSELESSVSALGLGLEAAGGLLLLSDYEILGFKQLTLGLGGQYLFGSVDDSQLKGWGFQAFLRFGL